jgi:hypothetical protein
LLAGPSTGWTDEANVSYMTDQLTTKLIEIRQLLADVQSLLPTKVEGRALSAKAKIPFKADCCRAALIWRVEELGRCACDSSEKGDIVAAMVLSRSAIETACALWHLKELVERQIEHGVQPDLDDSMMRLLVGSKKFGPEALNVLTFIDRVDKSFPIRRMYDGLSEFAHPNFDGAGGSFSKIDRATDVVHFGRGITRVDHRRLILPALFVALSLAQYSYKAISDRMPEFVKRCEEVL